jgi:hypothetical protein
VDARAEGPATALYIAGKTGITIGVGLTSVILAFAVFRGLASSTRSRIGNAIVNVLP